MARQFVAWLAAALLALLAGCSGDDSPTKPAVVPSLPSNDSPAGALARFDAALEREDVAGYRDLFTADYRFAFSAQTDPDLVTHYGTSWSRADEDTAFRHLAGGFPDDQGVSIPGSSRIVVNFENVTYAADAAHPESAAWYQVAQVPNAAAEVTIPYTYEPVTYSFGGMHELALVRGDAAVLPPGIPADSTHWYVRHWADLTTPGGAPGKPRAGIAIPLPASGTTWGKLKATYRLGPYKR